MKFIDRIVNKRFALCILIFVLAVPAQAQQSNQMPRIGYLAASNAASHAPRVAGLRRGLRELGYIEGHNILVEYRYAGGNSERLIELATELAHLKVDAIVSTGSEGALAAKQATSTIPIIMATGDDPVERGLVASLAKPGGNVTGLTTDAGDIAGKRLELLKETIPSLRLIGVLWYPRDPGAAATFKETEAAAHDLNIRIQSLELGSPKDFDGAFRTAAQRKIHALTVLSSGIINTYRRRIIDFAVKSHLPTMFAQGAHVEAGGLMYYGPNTPEQYRRAATYVDKILKGIKPADLPVERPAKFELLINLKTAKQIGLTIPPNVLARADRVIK
ncbi:MAG TPA: ABC transporter substrate-binding protein [Candidatus Binatia bacterium]